ENPIEIVNCVSAALPSYPAIVNRVGHPEILEWAQKLPVDCVGESNLGGNPIVEMLDDVQLIMSLRRGSQTQDHCRSHPLQQSLVTRRGRMVKLVDNDEVEVVRRERVP